MIPGAGSRWMAAGKARHNVGDWRAETGSSDKSTIRECQECQCDNTVVDNGQQWLDN